MKIREICKHQVITIDREKSLSDAATLMREHHIGALVVTAMTPEGPRVRGVVTDRDLVVHALAKSTNTEVMEIGDLVHSTVTLISESADIGDGILAMQQSGVRRLLVKNGDDRLAGIVSFDDLIAACATEFTNLARIISVGIERESRSTTVGLKPAVTLRIPAMGTAAWANVVL
ncbi:CBS domain-containing protein [Roseateles oligotrophus]|uniref:CBS domain-containing protein n=1 Tax=Roseateles oligotrophus TaxID=1769250 RepID=A0ABT2YML9_9BURK|nr:CBS domain-containing protein [Roseateles oligotrophus]MCV2371315.1 CBS domain-containing protein [Roseateles oligotrophus]